MAALCIKRLAPWISVALLDKAEFPRDKPCGDGLSPGVIRILSDLGDLDLLAGFEPVDHVTIAGPSNVSVAARLPNQLDSPTRGYVIPRLVFDERLARRASEAGADLLTRHTFIDLEQHASHVEVVVGVDGGGRRVMTAMYVIGADGAGSRVRRAVAEPRNDDTDTAIAVRSYASCEYLSISQQQSLFIEFSDPYLPAYAWAFPMDAETVNIGLGVGVDQIKSQNIDFRTLMGRFVQDLEQHGYRIGDLQDWATHTLPLASHRTRLTHGRVALIGDAASMINPTSGEGIYYGMEAGRMLAQHLSESGLEDVDLAIWETRFRSRFDKHFRSSAMARRLFRRRTWARMMVRAARRDPAVLEEVVSILFDEGAISPTGILRVAKAATFGSATRTYGNHAGEGMRHPDSR
jgi:geranylgeranyl reductase family protein